MTTQEPQSAMPSHGTTTTTNSLAPSESMSWRAPSNVSIARRKSILLPSRGGADSEQDGGIMDSQTCCLGSTIRVLPNGQTCRLGLRSRIFLTFEIPSSSTTSYYLALLVITAIIVSTATFVVSSLPQAKYQPSTCDKPVCTPGDPNAPCTAIVCEPEAVPVFYVIEVITITIFTIDYLARILTVHAVPLKLYEPRDPDTGLSPIERNGLVKTLRYASKWMNLIDLAAILPFYIALGIGGIGMGFLRVLRLGRVLRVFKLGKYSEGTTLLVNTLNASTSALSLLMFFMIIVMIIFGSIIYFAEQGTYKSSVEYPWGQYYRTTVNGQAEEISPFSSIPLAFYWVVITTTTVGFGDFYPTTAWGRLAATLAAYCGILCIALPVTIIGTNFTKEYEKIYGSTNNTLPARTSFYRPRPASVSSACLPRQRSTSSKKSLCEESPDTLELPVPDKKRSSRQDKVERLKKQMERLEVVLRAMQAQVQDLAWEEEENEDGDDKDEGQPHPCYTMAAEGGKAPPNDNPTGTVTTTSKLTTTLFGPQGS